MAKDKCFTERLVEGLGLDFPKDADKGQHPTEAEFAALTEFVKQRNPSCRLHKRERTLLSLYRKEFAEIKARVGGDQ